jgi:hypothetical protein
MDTVEAVDLRFKIFSPGFTEIIQKNIINVTKLHDVELTNDNKLVQFNKESSLFVEPHLLAPFIVLWSHEDSNQAIAIDF